MRWIVAPLLWLLALGLALLVLWRLWRGKPVVLSGRWGPRVVRTVAIILVVLGVGADRAEAAPVPPVSKKPPAPEPAPPLTVGQVTSWDRLTSRHGPWMTFKQVFVQIELAPKQAPAAYERCRALSTSAPPQLGNLLRADLAARAKGQAPAAVPDRNLIAALDEAEQAGYFDLWVTAYLWRVAGRSEGEAVARAELFARLARHARMTNALIKARSRLQPALLNPRAWMSKAGPRPADVLRHQAALKQLATSARDLYATADLGTWQRDGVAALTVEGGGVVTLIRAGRREGQGAGTTFRFQRLDLLSVGGRPAVLRHATYGKLELPEGKAVSAWELPRYLTEAARAKVERDVADALRGNEEAAGRLEKALPLTHAKLREQLVAQPGAAGAARLRLILALFDDAVMPPPAEAVLLPRWPRVPARALPRVAPK